MLPALRLEVPNSRELDSPTNNAQEGTSSTANAASPSNTATDDEVMLLPDPGPYLPEGKDHESQPGDSQTDPSPTVHVASSSNTRTAEEGDLALPEPKRRRVEDLDSQAENTEKDPSSTPILTSTSNTLITEEGEQLFPGPKQHREEALDSSQAENTDNDLPPTAYLTSTTAEEEEELLSPKQKSPAGKDPDLLQASESGERELFWSGEAVASNSETTTTDTTIPDDYTAIVLPSKPEPELSKEEKEPNHDDELESNTQRADGFIPDVPFPSIEDDGGNEEKEEDDLLAIFTNGSRELPKGAWGTSHLKVDITGHSSVFRRQAAEERLNKESTQL